MMDPLELEAREFAIEEHGDQKYGTEPYCVHLQDVHDIALEFGLDGDYLPASWLHDIVEDTKKSKIVMVAEIHRRFGESVKELVWAVSGIGSNRSARNADAHA